MPKAVRFANFALAAAGLFFAAAFLYVVYVFDLTGTKQFTGTAGRVVYHAVPAVLATLFLAALRFRPAYRINLVLVLLSTGISLYSLELVLTFAPSLFAPAAPEHSQGAKIQFDGRSKLQIMEDLRARGVQAVPSVTPKVLLSRQEDSRTLKSVITLGGAEYLPLGSVSNTTAVFCNEGGYWVKYENDEHGLNNPRGLWQAGRADIAIVGDSFAYGYCVPPDQNFAALIRQRYPATLNLATGGNGPLLELASIEEYVRPIQAKVVLWFFAEINDLCELEIERHSPLLMRYMTGSFSQGLFTNQARIDKVLLDYTDTMLAYFRRERLRGNLTLRTLREKSGLIHTTAEDVERRHYRHYDCAEFEGAIYPNRFEADQSDLMRRVLLKARDTVTAWGGSFYFVYLPEWQRYNNAAAANPYRQQVLALVRSLDIPVIDVHEGFQAHKDPLGLFPFRRQGHYNAEGHRVTAEAVLPSISSRLK